MAIKISRTASHFFYVCLFVCSLPVSVSLSVSQFLPSASVSFSIYICLSLCLSCICLSLSLFLFVSLCFCLSASLPLSMSLCVFNSVLVFICSLSPRPFCNITPLISPLSLYLLHLSLSVFLSVCLCSKLKFKSKVCN